MTTKTPFAGLVTSVQPRIRLTRSFDQRSHTYQGYVLRIAGERGESLVAIGEAAQRKHQFRAGDRVRGEGVAVADPRTEIAELYKVSKLKLVERGADQAPNPPPWLGVPPELGVYRERGHRRLAARTYDEKCTSCIWGCRMAVELIIDHWKPDVKRYRQETFCYGPVSCSLYKAGPTRKVPGRRGESWEEEDWVDEETIRARGPDEWLGSTPPVTSEMRHRERPPSDASWSPRIDVIIAQASSALAARWNGGNERVAYIVQVGTKAIVGFWERRDAPTDVRRHAAEAEDPGLAEHLETIAQILEEPPRSRDVQCLVHGWGHTVLVTLDPDSLRATQDAIRRLGALGKPIGPMNS